MFGYFTSFHAFLLMGGYAGFVWTAFGVFVVLFLGQWIQARRSLGKQLRPVVKLEDRLC